jgi:hypothetical protein
LLFGLNYYSSGGIDKRLFLGMLTDSPLQKFFEVICNPPKIIEYLVKQLPEGIG